jgi:hypothetical protein
LPFVGMPIGRFLRRISRLTIKTIIYNKSCENEYYRSFLALVNRFREIHNLFEYCSYGEQDLYIAF